MEVDEDNDDTEDEEQKLDRYMYDIAEDLEDRIVTLRSTEITKCIKFCKL